MATRDTSFDRRLEQLLVRRLRAGHDPESLLAELRTRLELAEAEAMLARAEARAAPPTGSDMADRVMAGAAYAWTVILVLQNISILVNLAPLVSAENRDPQLDAVAPLLALSLIRIGLLCVGVLAFKRWRNIYTTIGYALTILFAFPFGLYVQSRLIQGLAFDAAQFLSVSALGSYAAAFLMVVVWWRGRDRAPQPLALGAFD